MRFASKPPLFSFLLCLLISRPLPAQRDTFDIASFTAPSGWQRSSRPGFLIFQSSRPENGRLTSGQILVFASHATTGKPSENFSAEWYRLVVQPLRIGVPPRVEMRQGPHGWTFVIGSVTAPQPGNPITSVLYTATGAGRVMSILVNASSQAYLNDGANFVSAISLPATGQGPVAAGTGVSPSESASAAPATARPAPAPATNSLGDYVYAIPQGWSTTSYPDGVVHAGIAKNGERCQITVLNMRSSSGDVAGDAIGAFIEIFKIDPRANARYPNPSPTFTRGFSGEGWEYFMVQRALAGQVSDVGVPYGRVLAARVNDRLALILTTSKDPQVSFCFGELVHDEWPGFFASLRFKNWKTNGREPLPGPRLVGDWITATASVGLHYSFAPNGRYSDVAGVTYRSRVSPNEVLVTTQGFFGNGAYAINGNTITFTKDTQRGNPLTNWFRLEEVSTDVGQTWSERLCILDPSVGGEVCYRRDR